LFQIDRRVITFNIAVVVDIISTTSEKIRLYTLERALIKPDVIVIYLGFITVTITAA
jgi:hypothetical protein